MMYFPIIKFPAFEAKDLKNAILQAEEFDSITMVKKNFLFFMN